MGRQQQVQVLKGVVRQSLQRRFHTSPISSHLHRERPSVSTKAEAVESEEGIRLLSDPRLKSSPLVTDSSFDYCDSLNPKTLGTLLNKSFPSSLEHNAHSKVDGFVSTELPDSSTSLLSGVVPLLHAPQFSHARNLFSESLWAPALTYWPMSIRHSRMLARRKLFLLSGSPGGGGACGGGGASRGLASLVENSNNVEKLDEVVAQEAGASREGQGGDDGRSASVSGREIAVVKKRRKRKNLIQEVERLTSEGSAEDPSRRALSHVIEEGKTVNPASPSDDNTDFKRFRAARTKRSTAAAKEKLLQAFNEHVEVIPENSASHPPKITKPLPALEATEKKPLEIPAFSKPPMLAEESSSLSSTANGSAERHLSSGKELKSADHIGVEQEKDCIRMDNPTDSGMTKKKDTASLGTTVLATPAEGAVGKDVINCTAGKLSVGVDRPAHVKMAAVKPQESSQTAGLTEHVEEVLRKNTLNSTVVQVPSVSSSLNQNPSVESNGNKSGINAAPAPDTMLAVSSSGKGDPEAGGAEFSNPQELYRMLVDGRGGRPFEDGEKAKLISIFYRFSVSGWVSGQALSLYINSKFFPSAASRFRRFFMHKSTKELRSYVASMGATHEAFQFLFPLFAEFCVHEFPNEIGRYRELVNTADMTKPDAWYPFARAMKRKIIYHKGPTNSGKTYNALKRFMEAPSGIYCSPLRLLAMEVFDTVNMQGVYCSLHTGQEKKDVPFSHHLACTVEMCYLTRQWDVAVIDEIQMMSDDYRGWAWTRAFLGLQADEIHLCGDPSALPLVRNLCSGTGDDLVEYEYERFMPLKVAEESLRGDFRNIEAGDCIVAFSRRDIFDIKREVELASKHRCCVVYGALPPETRTQQAKLFNEVDNEYNVLVASDAIGMGLNLNIRRVVFFALDKFDGDSKRPVPSAQVKQIAGRAGRRGSLYPEGVTTTFFSQDLPYLTSSMEQGFESSTAAGLFPVYEQVELFASQLPNETFAKLLERFSETCKLDGAYFLCRYDNLKRVATMLEKVKGLSLEDRFNFCFAPVNSRDPQSMGTLYRYATAFSQNIPVYVDMGVPSSSARDEFELLDLEARHQVLSMYLWLSQHFPGDLFPQKEHAGEMASQIAVLLGQSLVQSSRRWAKRRLNQPHRGRPYGNTGWSDSNRGDKWTPGGPKPTENFVRA